MAHERQDEFRRAYMILYIKQELPIFEEIESSIENTETNETETDLLKERLLPGLYRKDVEELMNDPGLEIVACTWWQDNFIDTLPPLKELGSLIHHIAEILADDSEGEVAQTAYEVRGWLLAEIANIASDHIDSQLDNIIGGM
jgi:hypothetical protein